MQYVRSHDNCGTTTRFYYKAERLSRRVKPEGCRYFASKKETVKVKYN